nr:tRNA dimethylallyltransferase [Nitrosomonas nitrosa]
MKTKLITKMTHLLLQQYADRNVVQLEQPKAVLNRSTSLLPGLLLSFAILASCAPITPRWDARFGDAVGIARAQQTINPEASLNTEPVKGIDGQAGDAIFDNFRDSFRNPQPPMRGVLNLGTGGGSSQGSGGGN